MISNIISTIGATFKTFQIKDAFDIIIVALIIYYLFRLIRQTRSAQLIKGLAVLLLAYLISSIFDLTMISSILKLIFEFAVIILVVIFQPEIRKILEDIGKTNFKNSKFKSFLTSNARELSNIEKKAISDVADSCIIFSHNKTGALIVFERETRLTEIADSGTHLDSETSVSMFNNIFYKGAPLHDGACVLRKGRIYSAGCILPLSHRIDLSAHLGTRHRAAIGISEESDAVAVVVSEETGSISIAVRGELISDLTRQDLYTKLVELTLNDIQDDSNLFSLLLRNGKEKEDAE